MSFLSRIFGKKQVKLEISIVELPKWVNKKSESKIKEINFELKNMFAKIIDESKKTTENLEKLENAKLHNPDLITRAKQVMAGNRESYIKKVERFLDSIQAPEEVTIDSTKVFLEDYDDAIKELTKTSAKSYYVVSEFFGNEISLVARNIKTIDDQVKNIIEFIEKDDITKIDEIKQGLSNIQTSEQQISDIKQEINNLKQEKQDAEKELNKSKSMIESRKKSKSFSDYNKLLDDENKKQEELQRLEQSMVTKFSVLERALRKYSKITLEEKLVNNYLEKPLNSLLQDKELKIIGVLNKLKTAIEKGELELKDKKKQKTLEQLDSLTRESILDFKKNHDKLREDIKQIQILINKNNTNLEIKELEYKVEYLKTRIENATRNENIANDKLSKLDVNKLLREIKQNIKDVFGVDVVN